jgi:hypothetical protein
MANLKKVNTDSSVENPKNSSFFSDMYKKSSFADKDKRPKVIGSLVVLVIFVVLVGMLFAMYNFGLNIPGVSNVVDVIPVLKNLNRSPQNILPKTYAADQGINAYKYNVNFSLTSSGASGGNINQQFNGAINFKNPKSITSASSLNEKFSSSSSSGSQSLLINGNFIENGKQFFINFSKFPSVLNSGIKTGKWILLPNLEFSFLSQLEQQSNINYSQFHSYSEGNSVLNGTLVTHYVTVIPKKDYGSIKLLSLLKSVFNNITIDTSTIDLNEWVGLTDNRIYQESVTINKATVSGTTAKVYFGAGMTSFNSNYNFANPTTYINLQGKKVTSAPSKTSTNSKTSVKKK